MRKLGGQDQPTNIPLIETPEKQPEVTITTGGVAVTGAAAEDKATAGVVRGPWKNEQAHAAPGNTNEALGSLTLDWRTYSEWRQTKCPPIECRGAIWLDELDQAIHELIGELGELSTLIMSNGPFLLVPDLEAAKLRRAVEDEIGDVIFTASWVFDCIDPSFFGSRGRVVEGFLPDEPRRSLDQTYQEVGKLGLSPGILNQFHKAPDEVQAVVQFWIAQLESTLLTLFTNAAPISGRFKKLRWHRMKTSEANPFYEQASNLFNVCVGIDAVCALTGMNMLKVVHRNMAKLDARFPEGWKAGGGKR